MMHECKGISRKRFVGGPAGALERGGAMRLGVHLAFGAVALIGAAAWAQDSRGGDAVPIPHPLTMLLRDGTVQKELGLGPDQMDAVAVALGRAETSLWQLRDLPAAERNAPADGFVSALREKLATVLSGKQLERLDQLVLQARGIQGLLDDRVAGRLRLSLGQVERIRDVVETLEGELAALQRRTRGAYRADRVQAIQRRADRAVVALLERRQQVKLNGLMGRAFDLSRVRQVACPAPELRGVTTWVGSDGVTLASLRGQVVVVHFYAFGCINCVRNQPHYVAWQKHFASQPVRLVGIHRPETQRERVVETVRKKAAEAGLTHPIAVDNDSENWDAWANRMWPSVYLVDKKGFVRYWWYGELNWQGTQGEQWMRGRIEELLREEG